MSVDNQSDSTLKAWFFQHLRTLLAALYDPFVLSKSPLLDWLEITEQSDSINLLRKFLISAVESLQPTESTPRGAKSSRFYEILRQRYIEQQIQRKVADNIGLSPRQLQREEKIAISILEEYIWRTYHLEDRARHSSELTTSLISSAADNSSSNQEQDLRWLKNNTTIEATNIDKEIQGILSTLESVKQSNKVRLNYTSKIDFPPRILYLQAPILRQGLLNIICVFISLIPGGKVQITSSVSDKLIQIMIEGYGKSSEKAMLDPTGIDSLNYASKLLKLCDGSFETSLNGTQEISLETKSADFDALITLPIKEPITVLIIEDNLDTMELYRRYLVDTRYRFVGAHSAHEGLSLAKELLPEIIMLDVMMPEKDGWSFLGQLKVHPKLQHIPVIISSILQEANLAQTLGAIEFLHKPINRADLLSCLDRQVERLVIRSR